MLVRQSIVWQTKKIKSLLIRIYDSAIAQETIEMKSFAIRLTVSQTAARRTTVKIARYGLFVIFILFYLFSLNNKQHLKTYLCLKSSA